MRNLDSCPICQGKIFDTRQYDTNPNSTMWPEQHCFKNKSVAICRSCGGGFTHEYLSDDEISTFYNDLYTAPRSLSKAPKVTDFNELTPRFFSQVLYLKSLIQLYDGMRILEMGPNAISALPSLTLFCTPQYYYFDQVESPIIKAYGGRRLGNYASGENIIREFSKDPLDLIYSSHSLEHVNPSSLEEMFHAFSQVTASGGYLFFEVPDDYGFKGLVPPHTLFFTAASIQRLVERYDFEVIALSRWDGGGQWNGEERSSLSESCYTQPKSEKMPPVRNSTDLRAFLRDIILSNATIVRALKPWLLRYALLGVMRKIPTPYEATPFYRLLARKKAK